MVKWPMERISLNEIGFQIETKVRTRFQPPPVSPQRPLLTVQLNVK